MCVCVCVMLGTRYIKMFILDEADEMLSRGFKDQIYDVFRTLNENIQVGRRLHHLLLLLDLITLHCS